MTVSVSWNGDLGDYLVEGNVLVARKSPAQVRNFLVSERAAGHFRDIGAYESWSRDVDGVVRVSYTTGWGLFKTRVNLEMREMCDARGCGCVEFKSDPNDVLCVSGSWKTTGSLDNTSVLLTQIVRPNRVPSWIPLRGLIRSRIARVLDDLKLTCN